MSPEENKAVSRRLIEDVFTKGKLSLIHELCLPNLVLHDPSVPGGEVRGPDQFTQLVNVYRTAFPDLNCTIDDQIAQGEEVVTRYTVRGTHRGDFMGTPPTGKKINLSGITIDRYSSGKIAESWNVTDSLTLLQQIGVVPVMAGQTSSRVRS